MRSIRLRALSAEDIKRVQQRAGELALVGGIIYDLFHLVAAEKEEVESNSIPFVDFHRVGLGEAGFHRRAVSVRGRGSGAGGDALVALPQRSSDLHRKH